MGGGKGAFDAYWKILEHKTHSLADDGGLAALGQCLRQ